MLEVNSSGTTGFWSCWIKSSTLTLMVGLKSSANNNQCISIQSNRILGKFCSSPIRANLVCCDWLKIRTYPKIISATINSRRPNTCGTSVSLVFLFLYALSFPINICNFSAPSTLSSMFWKAFNAFFQVDLGTKTIV